MGDFVVNIIRWIVRIGFIGALIFTFVMILNLIVSGLAVAINYSVLGDVGAIVQYWLPFNLNVILVWLTAAVTALFAYRLAALAYGFINAVISTDGKTKP